VNDLTQTNPSQESVKAALGLLQMVSTAGVGHRAGGPSLLITNIPGAVRVVAAFIDELLQGNADLKAGAK
jgi:hypothetical protein